MTWQSELRSWVVASAATFALCSVGWKVYRAPELPDFAPTLQRANAALDTVNAPCKGLKCGTLATVDKLVVKIGDIAVDSQTQIQQTGKLINTASTSLTEVAGAAQGSLGALTEQEKHIGPLLDSLKTTSDAIPPAVASFQTTTEGIRPVLANATAGMTDFRTYVATKLNDIVASFTDFVAQWDAISADARKVADKTTTDYLAPVPWYMYPIKKGGELIDIGAAVARHVP